MNDHAFRAELLARLDELRAFVIGEPVVSRPAPTVRPAVRHLTPDEWRAMSWPPDLDLVDFRDRDTWITLREAMGLWGVEETTARERCKTRPIAIKPYGVWLINLHRAKTKRGTLPGEKRGN